MGMDLLGHAGIRAAQHAAARPYPLVHQKLATLVGIFPPVILSYTEIRAELYPETHRGPVTLDNNGELISPTRPGGW
jgi:hypothetical protein